VQCMTMCVSVYVCVCVCVHAMLFMLGMGWMYDGVCLWMGNNC
jgi:hypothetical protein